MATSPNYGWSEPDNTSLVKDGAQAMRTLGDAIDTSVWNVGYGKAGGNKIINADFSINQRAFTSTTTTNTYGFDRWLLTTTDGTSTYSAQTFTTGAAPVAGYESTNFARLVSTGQTLNTAFTTINQKIEDVRTFAGQTVTVSFWAKASTGTPNVAVSLWQDFGSGGSPSATTQQGSKVAITSSWARYSATFAVPSLSGKTIGTANNSNVRVFLITSAGSTRDAYTGALGIQSITVDFWGAQIEYGSKATPFQTASGNSLQNELAMCQRYYLQSSLGAYYVTGSATTTTDVVFAYPLPVQMRTTPSASMSAVGDFLLIGAANKTFTSINNNSTAGSTAVSSFYTSGSSGLTAGYSYTLYSTTGSIRFSAEL
jgi:hypothetical protein